MYIIGVVLLYLGVVPVTPIHHDIHKRMTNEEVLQIFQANHADVPNYDVVRVDVSHINKRDTNSPRRVRMRSPKSDIEILLTCPDGVLADENTPVMMAEASNHYIRYSNMPDVMKSVGKLMEDTKTRSSVVVSRTRSRYYALNGNIESRNLIVRSLPDHLSDEISRKARSVDDSLSSSNAVYHVVYEPVKKSLSEQISPILLNETELQPTLNRNKRTIPNTIYPEVLLVADYSSYRLHGSNPVNLVRYMLALWNSADMRYRQLTRPKMRLSIARIIIAKEPNATPYIFAGVINGNIVRSDAALDEGGKYFYSITNQFPSSSYDAVMMMTRHKLATSDGGTPVGLAYKASACRSSDFEKKFIGIGIFEDQGEYKSVVPAHELGHILGSDHDEMACPAEVGNVMTPVESKDLNSWYFSDCSINDFRNYLIEKPVITRCLHNKPRNTGRPLTRILGGSTISLDEQCQMQGGSGVCPFKSEEMNIDDVCAQLYCQKKYSHNKCIWNIGVGAFEGSPCGENSICVRGQCSHL